MTHRRPGQLKRGKVVFGQLIWFTCLGFHHRSTLSRACSLFNKTDRSIRHTRTDAPRLTHEHTHEDRATHKQACKRTHPRGPSDGRAGAQLKIAMRCRFILEGRRRICREYYCFVASLASRPFKSCRRDLVHAVETAPLPPHHA